MGFGRSAEKIVTLKFLWLWGCCLVLSFSAVRLAVAYPADFDISQVDVYLPHIRIYAGLLDENEMPIHPVKAENISIKLDGKDVPVRDISPFKDSGEGVAFTLLIDVSKTMAGAPFDNAVAAAQKLVEDMEENDRIALIAFGDEVELLTDFTNDRELLRQKLRDLKPDHQKTHFYAAVDKAYELNKRQDSALPRRRAILVITDAKDEGSGITMDDLLRQNEDAGIPIYSIGYTQIEERYLDNLKRLSELSGGKYLRSRETQQFPQIYQNTFGDIHQQHVIYAEYPEGRADGSSHKVIVNYHKDPHSIQAEKNVSFVYEEPTPAPKPAPERGTESNNGDSSPAPYQLYWLAGLSCLFVICLLILWLIKRGKRQKTTADEAEYSRSVESFTESEKLEKRAQKTETLSGRILKNAATEVSFQPEPETGLPEIRLIVMRGRHPRREYRITVSERGKTIGKEGADLQLDEREVSKVHCSICWMRQRLMIRDEGSERGTFLNGVPLKMLTIIEDNDVIDVGQCKLRLRVLSMPGE